ncbi:MAG: long-chain fatty acid--CoA ligase, partial [Clostridiales Family XIII bacterium]|nr:long-chain fatty acid--CoA ligase [Clostridiales Family XIII bacterium]
MLLTELLARNATNYGDEISLIELNPSVEDKTDLKWQEYELVEGGRSVHFRRELTWREFDDTANRVANMLRAKGIRKGEKVAILLMNCLEWLPIYFGILRSGATVVPLNFRYTSEEIEYCLNLADVSVLIFGTEFTERISPIKQMLSKIEQYIFVGMDVPEYAFSYEKENVKFPSDKPDVDIREEDDAAIYYSSGTTGFPKAILHTQSSLYSAAETEYAHHQQKKDDVFILIPPLYHTGAKMHWFGNLMSAGRTIILKGADPKWILETAASEKATIVWLLVPWAQDILEVIESGEIDLEHLDLHCWRLMHIGAQPVPPSLIHRWKTHFPHH